MKPFIPALVLTLAPLLAARGANLVPNGNFEAGNVGFTSGYGVAGDDGLSLLPEALYRIGSSPADYHPSFADYGDHTSGRGNMMIVNGAPDTSIDVWRTAAPITVDPYTRYYFEAWISSAYPASPGALTFALEGDFSTAVLGTGTAPADTGRWVPLSFVWDSGENTSVELYLRNANGEPHGNDFAVDDIYLGRTTSIAPMSDAGGGISAAGLVSVALMAYLSRRRPSA